MNDDDKHDMLQELLDAVRVPGREAYPQPNITAREYAEMEGISQGAAYERLERAVKQGRLKKKSGVLVDGHLPCIYWKA